MNLQEDAKMCGKVETIIISKYETLNRVSTISIQWVCVYFLFDYNMTVADLHKDGDSEIFFFVFDQII